MNLSEQRRINRKSVNFRNLTWKIMSPSKTYENEKRLSSIGVDTAGLWLLEGCPGCDTYRPSPERVTQLQLSATGPARRDEALGRAGRQPSAGAFRRCQSRVELRESFVASTNVAGRPSTATADLRKYFSDFSFVLLVFCARHS